MEPRNGIFKKAKGGTFAFDVVTGYRVDDITLDDSYVYFVQDDDAGKVSRVLKSGTSTSDLLVNQNRPTDVAVDDDSVYFPLFGSRRVMKVGKTGSGSTTLASGYDSPTRVAVDDEHVFFTDSNGGLVVQVGKNGGSPNHAPQRRELPLRHHGTQRHRPTSLPLATTAFGRWSSRQLNVLRDLPE